MSFTRNHNGKNRNKLVDDFIDDIFCFFQINARTELALRYNDISPLENHHCSKAFEILEKPSCNIFCNLPKDTFKKIREGMIRLVFIYLNILNIQIII